MATNTNFGKNFESLLNKEYIFTTIVLFQALFGGMALVDRPQRIVNLSNNPVFRFFVLMLIAYTATKQIETAIPVVIIFYCFIYLVRTPLERKEHSLI